MPISGQYVEVSTSIRSHIRGNTLLVTLKDACNALLDVYVYTMLLSQDGATPLFIASHNGHSQVAELLLSKGANVNLSNKVHVHFSPTRPTSESIIEYKLLL